MSTPPAAERCSREYAERWRVIQVHRPRTADQVETYLRLHAYPTLGGRQLGAIRRSDVQAWVKDLTAVLAPGSVELVYRWVSSIFNAAVGDRLIAASPCINITLPKRNDAEVMPLTVSEVAAMTESVPDRYRALIVFAAGMGLRHGECFGLTVDRVDFLRRTVRVDRQLVSAVRRARVRTAQEQGRLPHRSHARGRLVCARRPPGLVPQPPLRPRVHQPKGQPAAPQHRRRDVAPSARASRAARLGHLPRPSSLLRVASDREGVLGEGRPTPPRPPVGHGTLDTYGHLWPDSEDETRAAVDEVLAGVAPVLSAV